MRRTCRVLLKATRDTFQSCVTVFLPGFMYSRVWEYGLAAGFMYSIYTLPCSDRPAVRLCTSFILCRVRTAQRSFILGRVRTAQRSGYVHHIYFAVYGPPSGQVMCTFHTLPCTDRPAVRRRRGGLFYRSSEPYGWYLR
eukprot:gene22672-biopygen22257